MKTTGRVLFCTLGYEPGPVGGAERQARLQAQELQRRGWVVDVVTARDPGTRSGRLGGVRVHRLPRWNRHLLRTVTYLPIFAAWLLLRARRYDVVHVHLANLQADVAALVCKVVRRPLYVKLAAGGPRGEIARMRPVAPLTRYVGVRSAHRAQATSDEIVRDLRSIGVPENRIVRVANGLPPGVYRPASTSERAARRSELGLPADQVLLLYAGRFARYKGVLDVVAAWKSMQPVAGATLVLLGGAAIDEPVEVGTAPGMLVLPWTSNVAPYLQACDIYVHPSHSDGMPNAVLEAMASGLAVIATRIAAIPEMIAEGESGLLVEPGSVRDLRAAMERLIADAVLRRHLGAAAAARADAAYRIEGVVDVIEAAYVTMLAEGTA